ncbi:hypothetical protein M405DRAFT_858752 [Rhizopogon salebrosus TDB-379]|nr:hypothetical protein M405DRAFT_858752 [Rhizopogon salebrosus TDB-379]
MDGTIQRWDTISRSIPSNSIATAPPVIPELAFFYSFSIAGHVHTSFNELERIKNLSFRPRFQNDELVATSASGQDLSAQTDADHDPLSRVQRLLPRILFLYWVFMTYITIKIFERRADDGRTQTRSITSCM